MKIRFSKKSLSLVLVALVLVGFGCNRLPSLSRSGQSEIIDKWYRDEMLQTVLGKLPRPLAMIRNEEGSVLAISHDGSRIPLGFSIRPGYDRVFFDKNSDRIFIQRGRIIYQQKLSEKEETEVFSSPSDWPEIELLGAYGNRLVLDVRFPPNYAAQSSVRLIDINTGTVLPDTVHQASSEYTTGYDLFLNGTWYRLILDEKGVEQKESLVVKSAGLFRRQWEGSDGVLRVYFDRFVTAPSEDDYLFIESYRTVSSSDILDGRLGDRLFAPVSLNDPSKSLFSLNTQAPENIEKVYANVFHVRRLFKLDSDRIAQEVDDGLLVINLVTRNVEYEKDEKKIAELLKNEEILAFPIANHFDPFWKSYCSSKLLGDSVTNDTYIFPENLEKQFLFCLD